MVKNQSIELRRANFNIPCDLYDKIYEYSQEMGINMTNAYIVLLNEALQYREILKQLPLLTDIYSKAMKQEDEKEFKVGK